MTEFDQGYYDFKLPGVCQNSNRLCYIYICVCICINTYGIMENTRVYTYNYECIYL